MKEGELRWGRKYWASKREITSCVPDWRSPHYHQPWWQIDRTLSSCNIWIAKLSLSVSIDVEETTTVGAPSSGGEETLFEDKLSYNQLFWPFTQAFKAPNVVRWEKNFFKFISFSNNQDWRICLQRSGSLLSMQWDKYMFGTDEKLLDHQSLSPMREEPCW